jgi:GDP-L-fucose synthase
MGSNKKILILGSTGMVGSAIYRSLRSRGYLHILAPKRNELNLFNIKEVREYFNDNDIDLILLCAAKVGGIKANSEFKAEFIYENLQIQNNVINNAYISGIDELIFFGSSCIYPRNCDQPIKEEYLLNGPLEKTNDAYAIAKIAGIKMCQSYNSQYGLNYKSIMPTNLYGPGDNYDLNNSHVIPAIIRKTHEAIINKEDSITLWGSGSARRDILHVDDLAEASLCVLENIKKCDDIINVGSGIDYSIKDLAKIIKKCLQYDGEYKFDHSMPDGTPRKLLDNKKISELGWTPKIDLIEGIKNVYFDRFKR